MPTSRLPIMPITASSAINSATPISTARWDGPAPPDLCVDSLIVMLTAEAPCLLCQETRSLHQPFVPFLFVLNPAEVFFPGHEALVERTIAHELFPLWRFAHLLEQVNIKIHLLVGHARRHEKSAQHQIFDVETGRFAGRDAVPGQIAGDLV